MKKQALLVGNYFKAEILPRNNRLPGFTIVELLIVIVVIGILAAISIVAYNGIQERTTRTQQEVALNAFEKVLAMYKANTGMSIFEIPTIKGSSNTCLGTVEDYPEMPRVSGTRFWEGGCMRALTEGQGPYVKEDIMNEIQEAAGVKFTSIKGLFPGTSLRGVQALHDFTTNRWLFYMIKGQSCLGGDEPSGTFEGYTYCRRKLEH